LKKHTPAPNLLIEISVSQWPVPIEIILEENKT